MRSWASRTRSSNFRVSSSGASSGTLRFLSAGPLVDEEGVDEVIEGVVRTYPVIDADEQVVARLGRRLDAHVHHVDARLPADERVAHARLHQPVHGRRVRLED